MLTRCVLSVLSFFCCNVYSQDTLYVRQIVNELTSPAMHGRGYVQRGDSLAAERIAEEMKRIGLRMYPGMNSYFQPFSIRVNTFPDKMELGINGKKMKPGIDYIVSPDCPKIKGNYTPVLLDNKTMNNSELLTVFQNTNAKGKILIADERTILNPSKNQDWLREIYNASRKYKAIIRVNSRKLTWSVADNASDLAEIDLKADSTVQFDKAKKIKLNIRNQLIEDYHCRNIIGFLPGQISDTFLVFTAHYDHLGRMGKDTYFPGANDNASGTATMLNLAKDLAGSSTKPGYSILFIAFAAEEVGLLGSRFYTEHPVFPLNKIRFLFNIDLMGGGDKGATIVNATLHEPEFSRLKSIADSLNFQTLRKRGKAANSDHYPFSEKGVPAFFMYAEGGVTAYHDVNDRADKLPLSRYPQLYKLIKSFMTGF